MIDPVQTHSEHSPCPVPLTAQGSLLSTLARGSRAVGTDKGPQDMTTRQNFLTLTPHLAKSHQSPLPSQPPTQSTILQVHGAVSNCPPHWSCQLHRAAPRLSCPAGSLQVLRRQVCFHAFTRPPLDGAAIVHPPCPLGLQHETHLLQLSCPQKDTCQPSQGLWRGGSIRHLGTHHPRTGGGQDPKTTVLPAPSSPQRFEDLMQTPGCVTGTRSQEEPTLRTKC